MVKRILLAGLLSAIGMFVWSFVAHMVLPLGTIGIREIPNEAPVLSAMQAAMEESSGLYLFPGTGLGPDASSKQRRDAMQQYGQKLATSPSGMLIYHPPGAKALSPGQLGTEFLTEFAEALLLAFLLSRARLKSLGARVGFALIVGLVAAITTNVPYWNWYGFPFSYTATYMSTQIVNFLVAGMIAALVLKNAPPAGAIA